MDVQPQCPGEPYTITTLICRARQAKAYEKCPGCPHQERVNAMPPPEPARAAAPAAPYGELEAAPAPRRALPALPNVAAGIGLGAAALQQTGLGAFLRRVYHYF